jgi:tetratricopeptide (TPR) repeat protein
VQERKYWAFISYSHRDSRWADWLHKSIESYRPPRQLVGTTTDVGAVPKRLTPVFRDREELASATDLGSVINAALSASACQIVICSPQAAKSKWVNEEILAFKRLGREGRIFCLIVEGEPNASDLPGREVEECFPPALRFHLGPDGNLGTARTEPIAADARPGKDGKQNAKLKLLAGVLGVGFDTLRRRAQVRRNQRLALVTSGALAGMVLTSGLAAFALFQRQAAEHQRARAEADAETAKQTTNFLIDLFRISDPSEARGNAVTAREVLDKGAVRIEHELTTQPVIRAALMDTVGTVYMRLGLYKEASPLIDEAVATQRAAGAGADQQAALSHSLMHMGDLRVLQAQYDTAEKSYRDAIAIESAQPESSQREIDLATTLRGLGRLQQQQGKFGDAEHSLREALAKQHQVYGDAHGEIAVTLKDIARVMADAGSLNDAIPVMRSALGMQRKLSGPEPHPDTAESLSDLALLLEEHGDYDEAESLTRESIDMNRRLLGSKHKEIATGLQNLATVQFDKGDLVQAEATYREALAMRREVLGSVDPDIAITLNNLAFVLYDRGRTQEALATERESLAMYRKLFPGDHPEVARILNRIGFWLIEDGKYPEADVDLHASLAMRQRLLNADHPDIGTSLVHLAILQVAQRHYDEALASAHDAVRILAAGLSATHWKTAVAQCAQGAALAGLNRYSEAEPLLVQGLAILGKDGGAPPQYRQLAVKYLDQMHIEERVARRQGAATAPRVVQTRATEAAPRADADGHNAAIAGTTRP